MTQQSTERIEPAALAIKIAMAALAAYLFWGALDGMPEPLVVRSIFVGGVIALGFLGVRGEGATGRVRWWDVAFAAVGVAGAVYVVVANERITTRLPFFDPILQLDWVFGLATFALILELARRIVGWTLVAIALLFIAYTLYGPWFPGVLRHPGIAYGNLLEHLYLSTSGLYGSLTSLALAEVFMFIMLGAFLQAAGGSELFSRIAERATRRLDGGPAKAAVIGSSLFGMISGSGVANVYATGSITIPMMVRAGFRKEFAAAVEAVSSCLGQIIPPVMGASAFLLAEYTRTSYGAVAAAAITPALLYIFATYVAVHFETARLGIGRYAPAADAGADLRIGVYAHLLLPLLVLLALMSMRYTAYYSATVATLSVLAASWLSARTRMTPRRLLTAVETGMGRVVSIGVTLIAAGVAVAALSATGTAFKITAIILSLGQGEFLPVLGLVAFTVIVLGMGLPPVGAFLIASVFGAPAIMEFGVDAFSAYMFIFLFGVTSLITPPVCLSSYAAASIAGASFMATGVRGFLLALPAYVIPFTVLHEPIYLRLFSEGVGNGLLYLAAAAAGIVALAGATVGWMLRRASWIERALLLGAAVGLLWPSHTTSLPAAGLLAAVAAYQAIRRRRDPAPGRLASPAPSGGPAAARPGP